MTIRPVYERPRVLRTLLCLLVGVLALLWRAVPSFSWIPSTCTQGDTHQMCAGDSAIWLCYAFGCNGVCGDAIAMCCWDGATWIPMEKHDPYFYSTCMRLRTCGSPSSPSHWNCVTLKFYACICWYGHCSIRSGCRLFECGVWNTVDVWAGYQLPMSRA